ncbi:MAG: rane protein [Solirubrobacteraceae bacterium]|jgi:membrane protein|nr:rane protein [Solirubrobacteraceae bacterium]
MVQTIKRAFKRFQADNMLDHAAALTYYVMMSLFPALLVGVSLLGVLGNQSLVTDAVKYAKDNGAPATVTKALESSLNSIVQNSGGAVSIALVFGIAVALYGASGAFGAAGRALNDVYGVEETRSFIKHKLSDLAWTLVVILLAIVSLFCVFLGGGLAKDLFGTIGLGETAAKIFSVARWLIAIGAVLLIYAIVFAFAPNIQPRRRQIITPGAIAGVLIWIVASAGFFFYVSNFGKYNATYGAFAGAVILLLWLYISNIAFLFGAELNAAVDGARGRVPARQPASSPPPSQSWNRDNGASDGRVDEKYGRDALSQR